MPPGEGADTSWKQLDSALQLNLMSDNNFEAASIVGVHLLMTVGWHSLPAFSVYVSGRTPARSNK